jgi:hypothetical protein
LGYWFWFFYCFLDDFRSENLNPTQIIQNLIKFGFMVIIFLIFSYFNIVKSKKKYIYYYASKVVYYDKNFKETDSEILSDKCKTIKANWFLNTVFTTIFGKIFLAIFLIINFLNNTFIMSLIGILLLMFVLLISEFLEIIVFMAIYKQSNKSLKNFWKYFPKFQLNIEQQEEIHWSDYNRCNERLYSIPLFLFNKHDFNIARDYILAIFHIDISKNLIEQQEFKKFL